MSHTIPTKFHVTVAPFDGPTLALKQKKCLKIMVEGQSKVPFIKHFKHETLKTYLHSKVMVTSPLNEDSKVFCNLASWAHFFALSHKRDTLLCYHPIVLSKYTTTHIILGILYACLSLNWSTQGRPLLNKFSNDIFRHHPTFGKHIAG